MFAEYIPKINLGLGLVVVICFFLPWVSVDCGNVSFVKLSGFNLTTGKIPLDERSMAAWSEKLGGGTVTANESPVGSQKAHPQYYLVFVVVAALGVVFYSFQGMREYTRVKGFSVAAFGGFGLIGVVLAALLDFGLGIPPEAAMMIQTSYQVGFYGSVLSFLAVIVLSYLWLKSAHEAPPEEVPDVLANITVETPPPMDMVGLPPGALGIPPAPEELAKKKMVSEHSPFPDLDSFGEPAPKPRAAEPPQEKPPLQEPAPPVKTSTSTTQKTKASPALQPGMKVCTGCGTPVGPFQTKCIKCGTKLKLGN